MPESLDVGVTPSQVRSLLEANAIVSIVGYHRSGKSTLAEVLDEQLREPGCTMRMHTASSWFQHVRSRERGPGANFDPEIVGTLDELERMPGKSCWIVDDAEVMFAYATERVLAALGERVGHGRISLVLIRNRFVLEGEGWFQQRQSMMFPNVSTLLMRPMLPSTAVEAATPMFDGPARARQGEWLASMSGGVPGLMNDLYPFTPEWPSAEPDERLRQFARRKRAELELDRPLRLLVTRALLGSVLPSPQMLSDAARRELGVLLLAGMVAADYSLSADPLNGGFWHLVAACNGHEATPVRVPRAIQDSALNIEKMLTDVELAPLMREACGMEHAKAGALAQVFSASLYSETHFPMLVQPLKPFIAESLGRYGLVQVLRGCGEAPPAGSSSVELVDRVFDLARSQCG